MGKQWKQWQTSFWGAPKSLQMLIAAMKLKTVAPWKKSYDQPRQHIEKQRHHFTNKGLYSQSCGFSSSHVWMWELDQKEGWMCWRIDAFKLWCWRRLLRVPWTARRSIKPVNPKGNQPWIFTGKTDAEAEALILWLPDVKNWLIGKDLHAGKFECRRTGWQSMR